VADVSLGEAGALGEAEPDGDAEPEELGAVGVGTGGAPVLRGFVVRIGLTSGIGAFAGGTVTAGTAVAELGASAAGWAAAAWVRGAPGRTGAGP
jgi:hypothetical protein